ncbi:arylesterase [Cryomorpha ignava]|uniref:Arylesterase n=1 Tax=Cryomorpha ignava TaxID=101383 RepID=A0A7K3WJW5_9FLAO|nr:arylesterase [Cryomorpha ignava]NEN21937.1 arylesterase [Cryomorpha ignava]
MLKSIHLLTLFLIIFLISCTTSETEKTSEKTQSEIPADEKANAKKKIILFFGNSLSAGYGVEADESFPALIQVRIDSLNLPYTVVNAGVSGETTATGLSRIDWILENENVDIFVLELGANDGLRGLPPAETKKNLISMIDRVRKAFPEATILLAGMMVPPSMGQDYGAKYNAIYGQIQKEKNVELIPFLLKDVGGVDSLNQDDGIHPNPAGAKIVAENVWEVLGPLVRE